MSASVLVFSFCTLLSTPTLSDFVTDGSVDAAVSATVVAAQPREGARAATSVIVVAQAEPSAADDLNAAALAEVRQAVPQVTMPEAGAKIEAPYSVPVARPIYEDEAVLEAVAELPLSTGPLVFEGKSDEEIFDLAIDYLQELKTMTADFTQTAPSGNISTGRLQLSRPGRLRFDYDDPNPTLIVATQGVVYLHDIDLETTDSYPVRRTPLKFLLSRRIDKDEAVLSEVIRTENSFSLSLSSKGEETEGQLVLVFEAPELVMRRWAVFDARGGLTVVDLDNVAEGVKLANNAFRVPKAGGAFLRDR